MNRQELYQQPRIITVLLMLAVAGVIAFVYTRVILMIERRETKKLQRRLKRHVFMDDASEQFPKS